MASGETANDKARRRIAVGLKSYAVCLRHYFVWGEAPSDHLRGQRTRYA